MTAKVLLKSIGKNLREIKNYAFLKFKCIKNI